MRLRPRTPRTKGACVAPPPSVGRGCVRCAPLVARSAIFIDVTIARVAGLFANMKWRIDRVHLDGHVACTESYDLDTYGKWNWFSAELNSQSNEQQNSYLKRVSTQIHYMNGRNAVMYLKQYLRARNMRKRDQLERADRKPGAR